MSRRPGRIWLTLAVAVVTAGAGIVIIDHQARGDSSTAVAGGAGEPAEPDLQSPRWWDGSGIRVPLMDSFGLAAAARRPAVVQLAAVQELTSPAAPPASSRPSVTAAVAPTVVQAPSAAPEVAPTAIDREPADPPAASDSTANAMVETSSPTTAAAVPPATVPPSPPDQAPSPTSVPATTATPPPADLPEAGPTRGKSADHIPDQANGGSGNPDRPAPRTPEPAASG